MFTMSSRAYRMALVATFAALITYFFGEAFILELATAYVCGVIIGVARNGSEA